LVIQEGNPEKFEEGPIKIMVPETKKYYHCQCGGEDFLTDQNLNVYKCVKCKKIRRNL
jgi:predicted SprT family Zn-dependent metalloprotease